MAFNLMLAPFLGYVGLALATSMSATLNAYLLYHGLKVNHIYQISQQTRLFIVKAVLAASLMAFIVYWLSPPFDVWLQLTVLEQLIKLVYCIVIGVVSYFIGLLLLGVRLQDFKVI